MLLVLSSGPHCSAFYEIKHLNKPNSSRIDSYEEGFKHTIIIPKGLCFPVAFTGLFFRWRAYTNITSIKTNRAAPPAAAPAMMPVFEDLLDVVTGPSSTKGQEKKAVLK